MEPNQSVNNEGNGVDSGDNSGAVSGGGTPNPIQVAENENVTEVMASSNMEGSNVVSESVDEVSESVDVAGESVNATNEVINAVAESINTNDNVVFRDKPKKKNHVMVFVVILLVIATVCGIGFGVWAMMDGNSKVEKKDQQISELQSQLSDLSNQIAEANNETKDEADDVVDTGGGIDKEADLNGDIALDLLQEASVGKQLGYGVGYANVHARCENDGKVSYWIQYANGHRVSEDAPQFGNIMFEMGEDGTWQFELPGFTGYTEELVANCTILHGDK